MNKDYVLYHLNEALEEIQTTIEEIGSEEEYGHGDLSVAMTHLYHHINTAWNARNASSKEAQECSEADFLAWRQFPTDLDMQC